MCIYNPKRIGNKLDDHLFHMHMIKFWLRSLIVGKITELVDNVYIYIYI